VVSVSDLIREYLNELRASLRLAPEETDVIVDEAEDHLRETTAAGLAAGMTEREAQQAAISAFGSVTVVVRAHRERHEWNVALAGNLVMAAWRLGLLFLLMAGVSGAVDWIMDLSAGDRFVGFAVGAPVGRLPAAECRKLLSEFAGAHSCAQAWTQDQNSDHAGVFAAAIVLGLLLVAGYFFVRYVQSLRGRPGLDVLPRGLFPAVAVCCFGLWAVGLAIGAAQTAAAGGGPGALISGSITAGGLAVVYVPKLRRAAMERQAAGGPAAG
jgi:HAAS